MVIRGHHHQDDYCEGCDALGLTHVIWDGREHLCTACLDSQLDEEFGQLWDEYGDDPEIAQIIDAHADQFDPQDWLDDANRFTVADRWGNVDAKTFGAAERCEQAIKKCLEGRGVKCA